MRDFQRPAAPKARGDRRQRRHAAHARPSCGPISGRPNRRDLKNRVMFATVLLFVAKLATVAVPFTFKWATDALAGHGTAPLGPDNVIAWALATPVMMTLAYGGMRILMAAAHPAARRHFRQSGDERGAAAGDAHLRAYAPAVAALSSRAQDRRADAHPRARPQRHRDHRAHGAAAARADHRRAGPDRRRAAVPFRLALRAS